MSIGKLVIAAILFGLAFFLASVAHDEWQLYRIRAELAAVQPPTNYPDIDLERADRTLEDLEQASNELMATLNAY
jgi:hypothetical protein